MCRIPKVVVIAPAEDHLLMRRTLGSLEYDIVATYPPGEIPDATADVALVHSPDSGMIATLRGRGLKVAAFGPNGPYDADLELGDDVAGFKTRIWELLEAGP